MSDIGWTMGLVPESRFKLRKTLAVDAITSSIPYDPAPFKLSMLATEPLPQPTILRSVHCVVDGAGLVRATFEHVPFDVSVGLTSVRFDQSPLWEALGVSSGIAPGLIARFEWEGVVERL